jgi:hypothetical protein
MEPFNFAHEMEISTVTATFTHQDAPEAEDIVLEGEPEEYYAATDFEGRRVTYTSTVHLTATIPYTATPGKYKCRSIVAHTLSEKEIPFADDPRGEVDIELWVLAEPETPPRFLD